MICEPLEGRRGRILAKILERTRAEPAPEHCAHLGDCLIWTGPTSGKAKPKNGARGHGYPRMTLDGATVAVHRAMFTIFEGLIPPRKTLDHLCRRRLCVAIAHLEMVTHKKNVRRRDEALKAERPKLRLVG